MLDKATLLSMALRGSHGSATDPSLCSGVSKKLTPVTGDVIVRVYVLPMFTPHDQVKPGSNSEYS